MKLDGSAIHYLLEKEYGGVSCDIHARSLVVQHPLLFDEALSLAGHVVVVPPRLPRHFWAKLSDSLCVCVDTATARAARKAQCAHIQLDQGTAEGCTWQQVHNYLQGRYMFYAQQEAKLNALVYDASGFQALIDAFAEISGSPYALIDDQYQYVCHAGTEDFSTQFESDFIGGSGRLSTEAVDLFMASRNYRYMRTSHKVFALPGSKHLLMKNFFSDNRLLGVLMAYHGGDPVGARYARLMLENLTPFAEALYVRTGSFLGKQHQHIGVRRFLERALAGEQAACQPLAHALVEAGHDPDASYVLLCMQRSFTHEGASERAYLAQRFEQVWPHAHSAVVDENIFVLLDLGPSSGDTFSARLREIPLVARDNLVKVGASRIFNSIHGIAGARVQASIALEQGSIEHPSYWYYLFQDYALSWLLKHGYNKVSLEAICHPGIFELQHYDEAHASNLLETLAMFMACRYNASEAAKKLFVARSTLLNRLERIEHMTGIDFENTEERVYMWLSIRILFYVTQRPMPM